MTASSGRSTRPRLTILVVLALILLGFALRVYRLDAYSFWTDEALTPERASYAAGEILRNVIYIQGFPSKDTHPPFYYLIIHITRALFGESDFAYRYPSVLFSLLLLPLLYQFGRRLPAPFPSPRDGHAVPSSGGRRAVRLGLLVALLAAANPLQVYYAQEARMYTLLVLLGAGASYVLWWALTHPALTRPLLARYLLLYALLAGLAVYTHYTSVFLFAFQALFWAWLLWRHGLKWLIIGAVALAALAAIPLIPYTVPRLFTGAEANYTYVSPLVMLQDVVRFFNLGMTVDFSLWWVGLLNLAALALLLAGLWAARPWSKRFFLLGYLLAVVLGLMVGSLVKPMYQGVRHIMMGSPAFLLLVGYGLRALASTSRVQRNDAETQRRNSGSAVSSFASLRPGVLAFASGLAILLAGSALALANLYTNPAYAKDDFRALVRTIEQHAGDNDAVVYNNAVLLPVHDHYRLRDDIFVTALPVYPQMATGQEPELAQLAADYDRVWFVTNPPADRRDEGKLMEGWFRANTTLLSNVLFPSRTTESRVLAFRTPREDTAAFRPLDVEWEGLPRLTAAGLEPGTLAVPALWVDLDWDGERPSPEQALRFSLVGPDGSEALVIGHPLIRDEDAAWEASATNRRSYDLPLPPGFPPGTYTLNVRPNGSGDPVQLGKVDIAPSSAWPAPADQLYRASETAGIANRAPALRFDNGLSLRAAVPWDESVLPGNNLPLTLFWQTGDDALSGLTYRLEVVGPGSEVLRAQESRPGAPWLESLPAQSLLREVTSLYFRPETAPGTYRLRWQLLDAEGAPIGRAREEGTVRVEPWPLERELPPVEATLNARFGPAITLAGYDLGDFAPGADLPLTLVWRAEATPEANYATFIHLTNEATGEIAAQVDGLPVDGLQPTSGWRPGEVLSDRYTLSIPADLPPGRYILNAGLYNPDDGARPEVTVNGASQPNNQVQLAAFDIP